MRSHRKVAGTIAGTAIAVVSGIAVLTAAFAVVYSVPSMARLSAEPPVVDEDVVTIDDAITRCLETGLGGWELAEFAQRLTAQRFRYSRRNPWDSPRRAFSRGMGYCLQQARALRLILDGLGIESRLVMGNGLFPPRIVHGMLEPASSGGHAWLSVTIAGEEKDVCPGHPDNRPGEVHFVVTSVVRPLRAWMVPFAHVGSVIVNTNRDRSRTARYASSASKDARGTSRGTDGGKDEW